MERDAIGELVASCAIAAALFGVAAWPSLERAPEPGVARHLVTADFRAQRPRPAARFVANWVVGSGDARGAPFVLIDKLTATMYVFGPDGRLRGASPVLLGAAVGDDTVPGIGERAIEHVLPHERTTPAGRFVGERGRNARGEDVVWVDYDAAVSIHRVLTTNPTEHRLERLASATVADNRISYGCINVPREFFEAHVAPAFGGARAVIYVMPEVRPLDEVFPLAARNG